MADTRTMQVSVVTPEGAAYEGEALHVTVPAFDGEMAFWPMHAPLVGVLGFGELRVTRVDGSTQFFYLAGGVVQVADDEVSILAETVTPVGKLDTAAARKALAAAVAEEARGDAEIAARLDRMDDARARLRVGERARVRGELTADEILDLPVD